MAETDEQRIKALFKQTTKEVQEIFAFLSSNRHEQSKQHNVAQEVERYRSAAQRALREYKKMAGA